MPNEIQIVENSKKIEKIYQIIEFEIENANNQLSIFKKDNMNFILLILALIGFFAFTPFDVFLYKWFEYGILMMILCIGSIVVLSTLFLHSIKKRNENIDHSKGAKLSDNQKCDSCESYTICQNIDDPIKVERVRKYLNFVLIENIGLFYSAYIYTGFFFLITSLLTYFYLTNNESSKPIPSLFQQNSIIMIFLFLIVIAFIAVYFQNSRLTKKGIFKDYLSQIRFLSIIILVLGILIEIYGNYSKIPPFISITNSSQFSPLFIERSNLIPSLPLSLILLLYICVINVVLLEFFFSSRYIEKINQKLTQLLGLKYKIDRYQLGITPELNIEQISRKLSKQKITPPNFLTVWGIIAVPIPLDFDQCEETLYLALEDSES